MHNENDTVRMLEAMLVCSGWQRTDITEVRFYTLSDRTVFVYSDVHSDRMVGFTNEGQEDIQWETAEALSVDIRDAIAQFPSRVGFTAHHHDIVLGVLLNRS